MNKIDLNLVWADARAMGNANRDLLTAIAGMFLLLPSLVAEQFMVLPAAPAGAEPTGPELMLRLAEYATLNWPVMLVYSAVTSFGMLALQSLLLRAERLTVRESLQAALLLLPGFFLARIMQGLGVSAGLFLFMLPGFYLIGRLALIAPVAAAERLTNPLLILQRSAQLTRGNGWRIFALLALIFCVMLVISLVATSVTGVIAELLLPRDAADFAMTLVGSLLETVLSLIIVLVTAALYRAAAAPAARSWS
ncbi:MULTISPECIES: hypothetical protein [Sphingobium]|uniref:Glycerophosphoryl diester phosphodiesterase membrane domain-containing protein n=1 Tax=Sphingobium lignivorans TaxID=2735886 RepID=A0ABR6NLB8_9SPHN|nr:MULTISPECIES: hypothetical protein [Sphingobium]MBB5987472.1 hypothetical protein [Sphingobium lignivorans]